MALLLKSIISLQGFFLKRSLDRACARARETQRRFLLKILNDNRPSLYGMEHGFGSIKSEKEFRQNVPVSNYSGLESYIDRVIHGVKNVLTSRDVIMFNRTSGTSDRLKYIPVTESTKKATALLARQWLYRALLDHPGILDKKVLFITSPAIEGYAPSSVPFGSLSGLIYKTMPRGIIRSYVLPFSVSEINDYELRYYAMARLALGNDLSFIATPNPTTLMKTAETGVRRQEEIVRSIHDGRLFSAPLSGMGGPDSAIAAALDGSLKPDHERARSLEEVIKSEGELLPRRCWPSLRLIGCWLGGSVGYYADKLTPCYGGIKRRDIGYLASEGCVTVPCEDSTPAGILALQNNYYEFLPEEAAEGQDGRDALGPHELETGKSYRILITSESGLYRYDICDTVRVEKFHNGAPMLAFVRKTGDILNITGEKLHASQLAMAFEKVKQDYHICVLQFRAAENRERLCHDILLSLSRDVPPDTIKNLLLPAIDRYLREINIEYAQKRASKRLNPPRLHIMENDWEEETKKAHITAVGRDFQYKWRQVCAEVAETDKRYVKFTVEMGED